jgi:hypothetical protein
MKRFLFRLFCRHREITEVYRWPNTFLRCERGACGKLMPSIKQ